MTGYGIPEIEADVEYLARGFGEGVCWGERRRAQLRLAAAVPDLLLLLATQEAAHQRYRDTVQAQRSDVVHSPVNTAEAVNEAQEHKPFPDDGVYYCGWAGDGGIVGGCGHAWPCPTVQAQQVNA